MIDPAEALAEAVAHHQIRSCIIALARGEDRRDARIITGCFWPDADVNFGIFVGSFDEYLAWVVPGAESISVTLHTLGQSLIQVNGASAAVETHVTAYHRVDFGEAEHDLFLGGRYLDEMEQRDGAWRIARRTMLYDWSQDLGVATDFSQGLMGMSFLRGHPVGSAHGDVSEGFFA
jgi:hypothetical protein